MATAGEKQAARIRREARYPEVEAELMELHKKYRTDLAELQELPPSEAVSTQIIERVMEYCQSHDDVITCEEIPTDYDAICEMIADELLEMLTYFLTDDHRKAIVRYHAQGMSTAKAVLALVKSDTVIHSLSEAMGWQLLRQELIHRFAYLQPGSGRWPEKKYGDVWRDARAAYKAEIQDIPLSDQAEQVKVLSDHVQKVMGQLEKDLPFDTYVALLNTLVKLVGSISKITPTPTHSQKRTDVVLVLPTPELLAMLPPEQRALLGDTDALLSTLQQSLQILQQQQDHVIDVTPDEQEEAANT